VQVASNGMAMAGEGGLPGGPSSLIREVLFVHVPDCVIRTVPDWVMVWTGCDNNIMPHAAKVLRYEVRDHCG
jgi:hypothetical protein